MYRALVNDLKSGEYWKKMISVWINLIVYMGGFIPFILLEIDNLSEIFGYYTYTISMLVVLFFARACPNRISKTLLLCPLTLAERKRYVYIGYGIRILLSLTFFLVLNIPVYIFFDMNMQYFGIETMYFLLYIIGINVYVPPVVPSRNSYERKYNLPKYYNFWEITNQIVGFFGMVIMVDLFRLEKQELLRMDFVFASIFWMLEIICVVILLVRYLKPVMNQAMQGESYLQEDKKA